MNQQESILGGHCPIGALEEDNGVVVERLVDLLALPVPLIVGGGRCYVLERLMDLLVPVGGAVGF